MNTQNIRNILLEAGKNGKIFSCTFKKRSDGSMRKIVARIRANNYLKGGSLGYCSKDKDTFICFDMVKRDFRSISLEGVKEIKYSGKTIKF